MASVFTKIIAGELPGRFVWKDDRVVAFLTIAPLQPGHTLVVPRVEVDHWHAIDAGLMAHLTHVAQSIGKAIERGLEAPRVGLMVAGIEVPHVHLHVTPIHKVSDLDFANADADPQPGAMDAAAEAIRGALRELGFAEASD